MSRIRSRGNKATELELAKLFRASGITGWRRGRKVKISETGNVKPEGGQTRIIRPDFIFPKNKVAVFVDGELLPKLCKNVSHSWMALPRGQSGTGIRRGRRFRRRGGSGGWRRSRETRRGTAGKEVCCGSSAGGSCASGSMSWRGSICPKPCGSCGRLGWEIVEPRGSRRAAPDAGTLAARPVRGLHSPGNGRTKRCKLC